MTFRQFLQQYGQTIIILIALSASGIGWVLKKLAEQAAIRRAQMERERRTEEMLRTGQGLAGAGPASPASPAEARERLAEIARRRQAQVEQARRRGQPPFDDAPRVGGGAAGVGGAGGGGGAPPIIIMGPKGPIIIPNPGQAAPREGVPQGQRGSPVPTARPAQPGQRSKQQRQQPQPRPQQPKQKKQPQPRPQTSPPQALPQPSGFAFPSALQRAPAKREADLARAVLRLPPVNNRSIGEYRRALAMMEVLAQPLCLRTSESDGPLAPRT